MGESTPSRINRAARSASLVPLPCHASIASIRDETRRQLRFEHRVAEDNQIYEIDPSGGQIDERLLRSRQGNSRSNGSLRIASPEMGLHALAAQPLTVFRHSDVRMVIVRNGEAPELGSRVMARIALETGQPQCRAGADLRRDHDISTDVEVEEDLLVPTADQFLHCDSGRSGVGAGKGIADVKCVLLLWEAHGEECGAATLSYVTWSAAICG